MSNLAAFKNLVRRAQVKADNQICLIENMPITTNVGIILYADKRIKELEATIQAMLETAEGAGIPRCQFDEDLK
ncbi:hypothetical protein AC4HA13_0008 [Escherichia phage vB_EcoM_4HA13]|uniref:Uncharacterized protein n=1 Tax=Escherichia phage vB_EcoM_4HA13 TaxID=2601675 RepID=A0A7D0NGA6_9CAUD|nr:hypothetical protein HYP96_gp08 [Escherichia phage vB_EcoM_4HA13]QEM42979.1 hypothetical protein AC4HA13_0008 [Escherichia phage vB_EcoM_4HA13]